MSSLKPEGLSREDFLRARLADLGGYWLEIQCGCGVRTFHPCVLLAQQQPAAIRVTDVLARLRCRHCRGRPARVGATNDPTSGGGWRDREDKGPWKLELAP